MRRVDSTARIYFKFGVIVWSQPRVPVPAASIGSEIIQTYDSMCVCFTFNRHVVCSGSINSSLLLLQVCMPHDILPGDTTEFSLFLLFLFIFDLFWFFSHFFLACCLFP